MNAVSVQSLNVVFKFIYLKKKNFVFNSLRHVRMHISVTGILQLRMSRIQANALVVVVEVLFLRLIGAMFT